MALGIAPALVRVSIGSLIQTPNVANLRIARARVRQGRSRDLRDVLDPLKGVINVGTGICWLQGKTAAQAVVNARLIELDGLIRSRVPRRTGRARRSVSVGRGHPELPVVYPFVFNSAHSQEYHAGIAVEYGPYLEGLQSWFFDTCDEWYEETSRRALEAFLVFFTRCATRR